MVKYRDPVQSRETPAKLGAPAPQLDELIARVYPDTATALRIQENILRKLGWKATDTRCRANVKLLIGRIMDAGLTDPEAYLSIREAEEASGVAERTLRRYIADGRLETQKVKGPRGSEHRIYAPHLFLLVQDRAGALEKTRSTPIEDLSREISSLCKAVVEQQARTEQRTDRLLEELRLQGRVIEELRTDQRETRQQMMALQEQMIRALMPRQKPSVWAKLFDRS